MVNKQVQASTLKAGGYVVFDGLACVIKSIETSKTGKHGHAKCRIESVSLVGNKKIVKILPGHDNVEVPIIEKKTAQVLSINNDTANVMDIETYEIFDLEIPEELKDEVREGMQVVYWTVLNEKVLKQIK